MTISIPSLLWTHPICADYRRGWRLARLVNLFRVFALAGERQTLRLRLSGWRANLDYPVANLVAFMERLHADGLATWTVENAEAGADAFGTLTWAGFLVGEATPVEAEVTRQPRPTYPSDLRRRDAKNGAHSTPPSTPQGLHTRSANGSANGSARAPQDGFAESHVGGRDERDSLREREISPDSGENLSLSKNGEVGSGEERADSAADSATHSANHSANGSAPAPKRTGQGKRRAAQAESDDSAWAALVEIYGAAAVGKVQKTIAAMEAAGERFGNKIGYARRVLENDQNAMGAAGGRASPVGSWGPSMADIEAEIGEELEGLNIYERFPGIEREGGGS